MYLLCLTEEGEARIGAGLTKIGKHSASSARLDPSFYQVAVV